MPIIRIDVPEGHPREKRQQLKRMLEECIARTWARDHIYIAVNEALCDKGDQTVIMTVDLRPGRGKEPERASALYREVLEALRGTIGVDPDRFVLLIREFPDWAFVVDGGKRLPSLDYITPALAS